MSTHAASDNVVVTGISAWTCFGRGVAPLIDALSEGRTGLREMRRFPTEDPLLTTRTAMEADVSGELLDRGWRNHEALAAFGLATAADAARDAALEPGTYPARRVAVMLGTSNGSTEGVTEVVRNRVAKAPADHALLATLSSWIAHLIARRIGARGPNLTIDTACSSGLNSIGQAFRLVATGRIDCALAGGVDLFSFLNYTGFNSLGALDPRGCRPFDAGRGGISLGDGAAFVVLERESAARQRGARVAGYLRGYASAGEGYHATAPDPHGRGALSVMSRALEMDGAPRDLRQVSAHGTGTPANDGAEMLAIEQLVRAHQISTPVFVYSIKSQLGHTLGAAGALQVVAALACLERHWVPGTIGLEAPIAHESPIELPSLPREIDDTGGIAICNAFGFGGSVASVALRRELPRQN
jgi:3-oxoacyl-[acyl-carrier-protein] synthase II